MLCVPDFVLMTVCVCSVSAKAWVVCDDLVYGSEDSGVTVRCEAVSDKLMQVSGCCGVFDFLCAWVSEREAVGCRRFPFCVVP